MELNGKMPTTFCGIVIYSFLLNGFKMFAETKYGDVKLTKELVNVFQKEKNFVLVDEKHETHMRYFFMGLVALPDSKKYYLRKADLVVDEVNRRAELQIYDLGLLSEFRKRELRSQFSEKMLNINFSKVDSAIEYKPASFYYDEHSIVLYDPLS